MSTTPPVPSPGSIPPDPYREVEPPLSGADHGSEEASQEDIEAEVDALSKINDPANDDVFKHLRGGSGTTPEA